MTRPSGSVLPTPGVPGPGTNLFRVAGVPTPTWMPNDAVHALATDGNYVYLGGDFTGLHAPTGSATTSYTRLARINLLTGAADPGWTPTVDGSVLSLALNASGTTLYLGGTFTTVDGQARANLAAVSTTGSGAVTAFDPEPNDRVQTLLVDGSELVVGGCVHPHRRHQASRAWPSSSPPPALWTAPSRRPSTERVLPRRGPRPELPTRSAATSRRSVRPPATTWGW